MVLLGGGVAEVHILIDVVPFSCSTGYIYSVICPLQSESVQGAVEGPCITAFYEYVITNYLPFLLTGILM